jgi:hypothetical protein
MMAVTQASARWASPRHAAMSARRAVLIRQRLRETAGDLIVSESPLALDGLVERILTEHENGS